jgi:hypothetical protein
MMGERVKDEKHKIHGYAGGKGVGSDDGHISI